MPSAMIKGHSKTWFTLMLYIYIVGVGLELLEKDGLISLTSLRNEQGTALHELAR